MERRYRVRDFGRITGVTIKALQHYDRLGLLRPSRTPAGHRIYSDRDVERVQQIVALKSIGVPLKRIRTLLDKRSVPLADALKSQRAELETQQREIGYAVRAIAAVEADLASGTVSESEALTQLVDLIAMQNDVDAMRQYFSPEAWAQFGTYWVDWPPERWRELLRDAESLLGESPDSEKAEALVARFYALWHQEIGADPQIRREIHWSSVKAFRDREHWPPRMQRRWMEFKFAEIGKFLSAASIAAFKKRGAQFFAPSKRAD